MEWNDEEKVNFSGPVVYDTNGRHDHAGACSPKLPKYREPEVQVPVVPASNEFVFSDAEDGPGSNDVANLIGLSACGHHNVCVSGYRQSTPLCESIAQYQDLLDPSRMMAKDAEEYFDNTCRRWCQGCPVRIAEVGCSDESWLKRTCQWHITFNRGGVLHGLFLIRGYLRLESVKNPRPERPINFGICTT